jgi:hypothetical protein
MDGHAEVSGNRGTASSGKGGISAGAILVTGNARVHGNAGAGIISSRPLAVTLNGRTRVTDNGGRGIIISANLFMADDAVVSGNRDGGLHLSPYYGREVILGGNARVTGNTALYEGGGIYLYNHSTLTMRDNFSIDNNESGCSAFSGTLNQNGGGGGIFMHQFCRLIMEGGSITHNRARTPWGWGGGVAVVNYFPQDLSSFTLDGGKIIGNTAGVSGGGVAFITPGIFQLDSPDSDTPPSPAGQVFFTMNGGVIAGNRALSGFGGGIAVGSSYRYVFSKSAAPECIIYGAGEGTNSNTASSGGNAVWVKNSGDISTDKTLNSTVGNAVLLTPPYTNAMWN